MIQISDHVSQGLGRFAAMLKDKPNAAAWVTAFCNQVQAIEEAFWELYTLRNLTAATGAQVDGLGKIVGIERGAKDDTSYKTWIRAKIKLDRCSGTIPEILDLFALLVPAGNTLELVEWFPAGFVLRVGDVPNGPDLAAILRQAKAGGVKAVLEWIEVDPATAFTLDAGPGLDAGHLAGASE